MDLGQPGGRECEGNMNSSVFVGALPKAFLLLLPMTAAGLFAQQGYPQSSQYTPGQPVPIRNAPVQYGQYAQPDPYNQPQAYPPQQQAYPAQQPYPGQQQAYPQQQPYDNSGQYADQYPDPYPDPGADLNQPQQQPAQFLSAEQLEQMVAPIALYPDTLVAQILAAATYPAQVVNAGHWLQAQGNASPQQIAAEVNSQATWDPAVKALTAFPQVLAMMDQDIQWTTDLGNAYYNQPQDVLQVIQVMRQRAESAGNLQNTPQESVTQDQGNIQIAPVNPQYVYVPVYNPWYAYGAPVSPYPGFSLFGALESFGAFAGSGLVRFGPGIAMGAFLDTPFGLLGWGLDWLGHSILFHHSNYYSRSTSVAHWGRDGYGSRYGERGGGYNRQASGGYGSRAYGSRANESREAYGRSGSGYSSYSAARPSARYPEGNVGNRFGDSAGRGYTGNGFRQAPQAYDRGRTEAMPARPQTYARSGGYGYSGNGMQAYAARPGYSYASPERSFGGRSTYAQSGGFAQRSFTAERSNQFNGGRQFAQAAPRQERSGGFHLFGGGRGEGGSHSSFRAPKAPRSFGGGKHSGGGGGGHHGGGHHR
jgi:hypothetical protein